ncbi:MAG: ABC transporter permease subunit [Limimaricola sp.]|uniref:ABC transporter permease n=1 Tax=Limimaricola sp. TaxID=2211665 RepID=UPI001DEB9DF4|nr:ABC transporter permease [Limimaricola sp.]MBI1416410.1 ABC transporter permease subunit [Limimaricola sp.]
MIRFAVSATYMALIYAFIFLPVYVLVLFSFQDGRFPIPPFKGFSLRWHQAVLSDGHLMAALGHSFVVAVLSSAVSLLLGFLAARGLAHARLRGAGVARGLITAPLSVSYLVIGLGLLASFNLANVPLSLMTVTLGHVVINAPLCFAICASAMGAPQLAAERAARDLGAGEIRVMALVTAPMILPALVAAFLLSMTFSWDEFIIAFLLSRFDVTLPVELWSLLRSGLNPKTNAIGSLVFLVSAFAVLAAELALRRRA